jgi:hypothetical protein
MAARSRNLGIGASCYFRPIFNCAPAPLVTLVPNQAEARYCVLTGATFGFFDDVHCRRQLHQRFTSRRKIRARLDSPGPREATLRHPGSLAMFIAIRRAYAGCTQGAANFRSTNSYQLGSLFSAKHRSLSELWFLRLHGFRIPSSLPASLCLEDE